MAIKSTYTPAKPKEVKKEKQMKMSSPAEGKSMSQFRKSTGTSTPVTKKMKVKNGK